MSAQPRAVHWGKFHPSRPGGIESVVSNLAKGAAASGWEVDIVSFPDRAARVGSQPLSWRYFFEGIGAAGCADVLHVHCPNLLTALMLPFVSRRVPVVLHWHSDVIGKGWLGRLARPLELYLAESASVIVATSKAYADASPLLRRYRTKVRVIPLGVSPEPVGVEPEKIGRFINGRRLILSVGRLVAYKGFGHLITAARRIPDDTAIVIVGDGPCREALEQQTRKLGLSHKVLLAGPLDQPTVAALRSAASLFVLPSVCRSEAFGVAIAEAMAAGLPVVATKIPGSATSWVNQHGVTGLNCPRADADALARSISAILADDEEQARMSAAAQDRWAGHFTAGQMIESHNRLNQELAQRRTENAHAAAAFGT